MLLWTYFLVVDDLEVLYLKIYIFPVCTCIFWSNRGTGVKEADQRSVRVEHQGHEDTEEKM